MNSRNWVRLFFTTLFIGGATTGIVGFILKWQAYKELFISFDFGEIFAVLIWLIGVGFIFSLISQMGFFSYLTVNRFGIAIFRSVSLWNAIQWFLILFVLFDLVYLRYQLFAVPGESLLLYLWPPLFILIVGIVVAYFKSKLTNKQAFAPALFFMVVVTIVEWVPALQANDPSWLYLMLLPLLVCNAYQLLILQKLTSSNKKR